MRRQLGETYANGKLWVVELVRQKREELFEFLKQPLPDGLRGWRWVWQKGIESFSGQEECKNAIERVDGFMLKLWSLCDWDRRCEGQEVGNPVQRPIRLQCGYKFFFDLLRRRTHTCPCNCTRTKRVDKTSLNLASHSYPRTCDAHKDAHHTGLQIMYVRWSSTIPVLTSN